MTGADSGPLSLEDKEATIMVVDDDAYVVDFLDDMLSREGYRVRSGNDSRAALQSVLSEPPDLVLLDIRMPGMDGFTFCRALKEDARTSHVPVIFISGLYEAEDKIRAFEVGGMDYLTKPFSDIEILARIGAQLRLHRWQVSLEQQVAERTADLQDEIVERKRVEEQREALVGELKAKNRELEHFAYSISHDLKTPMITIRGFLKQLEKDVVEENIAHVQDDVQRISSATKKMQQMLEDVLELSRIGRFINPPEETPLSDLALEAVAAFEQLISKDGVQVDVEPDMPTVHVDRPRLLQVYQNLIGNALKYMGDQDRPHIEIGSRNRDGETAYFVRDNGIGIDPRFLEKVFNLFDKLDPKSQGTGVGLALCKRIVEAYGGRIWAESEGLGEGCTFYFTLGEPE